MQQLFLALSSGRVDRSLELLKEWLVTATPGEPELLLQTCPKAIRANLAVLLLDVLSRYPDTVIGVPVQIYGTRSYDTPQEIQTIKMQEMPSDPEPIPGLVFLGWLDKDVPLPVNPIFRSNVTGLQFDTIDCKVAVFQSNPLLLDLENRIIPPEWWADLFTGCQANIFLSAQVMHPYPQSLEVARALDAGAHGFEVQGEPLFSVPLTMHWAQAAGALFRAKGEEAFPGLMPG